WQRQAGVLDPRFEETALAGATTTPGVERDRAEGPLDRLAAAADTPGDDAITAVDDGLGEHIARLQPHQDDPTAALAQDLQLIEPDDQRLAFAGHAQHTIMTGAKHRRARRFVVGPQREEGLA